MSQLKRSFFIIFPIVFVIVVFDQITKLLIVSNIAIGEFIPVISNFFNLTLTYNKGAAFGILSGIENDTLRYLLLFGSTLLALVTIFFFILKEYLDDVLGQLAIGLIIGGAFGNILDRVRLGAVVDFLDFYIGTAHWPAFNIADSAICIGVFILVVRKPRKHVIKDNSLDTYSFTTNT
jgi:signal peptidase II